VLLAGMVLVARSAVQPGGNQGGTLSDDEKAKLAEILADDKR
jgi:hypothetical protein